METFNHKRNIEISLKETVDKLVSDKNLPIVFGHVAWGRLSEKGAMRLSHIKPNDSNTNTFLSKDVVFNRHIKEVGRNKTFLDFLLLYWFEGADFNTSNDYKKTFSFQIMNQTDLLTETTNKISISKSLSKVLAPINLIKKYFEILDDKISKAEKEYYTNELDSCRYKALDLFEASENKNEIIVLKELAKKYKSTEFENVNLIHLLGAIQSALLFVKASFPEDEIEIGFISNSIAIKANGDKSVLNNPIIVLSTPIKQNGHITNIDTLNYDRIKTTIENFCRDATFSNTEDVSDFIKKDLSHYIPDDFKKLIADNIKSLSPLKIKPDWTKFILYWNSALVQYLRNSIHEGKSLNFTFVVADVSEIKDCGLFDIVHLDFTDGNTETFHPYNLGKEFDETSFPIEYFPFLYEKDAESNLMFSRKKFISYIKRNIEKKNYSWFQDGKYALLWDATFPSKHPHSLIRIKNSSWEVLLNEIRNQRGKDFLDKISLSMVFLRQDQSGGIIIKDKLVSSFRKGTQWSLGLLEKDNKVKRQIANVFTSWEVYDKQNLIDLMTDVIISISDDPHSGCILVIAKMQPDLQSMGDPWRTLPKDKHAKESETKPPINPLDLSKDEIAALMGMDGATCIYFDNDSKKPAISFRNILKINSTGKLRDFDKHELDGEGSRKWSSLNTARMENIDLVIAVSQDGPIYHYIPTTDNKIKIDKLE